MAIGVSTLLNHPTIENERTVTERHRLRLFVRFA